eukprot:snap_masked-scaffold_39-processed-gene-2.8-mRNA-1 protein AED:1.00 eAED:1.00 QI:0/-1/0/0/-1/1/1/0/93
MEKKTEPEAEVVPISPGEGLVQQQPQGPVYVQVPATTNKAGVVIGGTVIGGCALIGIICCCFFLISTIVGVIIYLRTLETIEDINDDFFEYLP